ncbi:MAG: hypothetical protein ACD_62C00375G0002 [uncultured bacterium]|nr:MAG: hypothetical protein ACD_62C00375G0002 [uncultured bacterium]HLD45081.1 hypothetical protein [bacterium]
MKGKHINHNFDLTLDPRLFGTTNQTVNDDVLKELIDHHDELRSLARQINNVEVKQMTGIMTSQTSQLPRKIERIYSKGEIRELVCRHLIPAYQHEYIIQAVTNYLYTIHVSAEN